MHRSGSLVLAGALTLGVLALGACGGDDGSGSEPAPPDAPADAGVGAGGWDPGALATAEQLAADIRAGGVDCDEYSPWDYDAIVADYEKRLPIPAAMATCTGPGGEDITFEVFADEQTRDDFLATKLHVVCTAAERRNLILPGIYVVEGPTWILEPDAEGTAHRLAGILGGESELAACPKRATTAPAPTAPAPPAPPSP